MQYIIIDRNGEIIAQYSSWDEVSLQSEIEVFLHNNKEKKPRAYKCELTHIVTEDVIFKKVK